MICSKHEFSLLPPDIFIKPFLLIGAYNGPYIQDSVGGEVIFCLLTQACQGIRWYQEQNNKRKNKKKKKNPGRQRKISLLNQIACNRFWSNRDRD